MTPRAARLLAFSVLGATVACMGGLVLLVILERVAPETMLGILITGFAVSVSGFFVMLGWVWITGQWADFRARGITKVIVPILGSVVMMSFMVRMIVNLGAIKLQSDAFGMGLVRQLWSFADLFR